jgi:hypothetical protein
MQANQEGISGSILVLLGALLITLWCLNSAWISWLSGWRSLSKRFRAQSESLAGTRRSGFPFDICFRYWLDYTNLAWVTVNKEALHLSVVFPFRIAHPPLAVPWEEIEISSTILFWRKYVELKLGIEERIPLRISKRMANRLGIPEDINQTASSREIASAKTVDRPIRFGGIGTAPPPLQ